MMSIKRFYLAVLFLCMVFCCSVTGCMKTPQEEDDLPVEEWTVMEVNIVSYGDAKYLQVIFDGISSGLEADISTDFETHHLIKYRDLCTISDITYESDGSFFNHNTLHIRIAASTPINNARVAKFYTGWFYESEQDLHGIEVYRKIRIVTSEMPVTDHTK